MNESRIELTERLRREGRWSEASQFKDQVLRGLREQGVKRNEAGDEAWRQMEEQYPPRDTEGMPASDSQSESAHCGRVSGLSDIPSSWPTLPANASLAAEIQWVQALRLDVVEELPGGGTRVRLDRADTPAPSKGAIGWLETSIRSYAKFVDVAAKVTATVQDEQEAGRREKLAIDEVRGLLAEMVEDSPDT